MRATSKWVWVIGVTVSIVLLLVLWFSLRVSEQRQTAFHNSETVGLGQQETRKESDRVERGSRSNETAAAINREFPQSEGLRLWMPGRETGIIASDFRSSQISIIGTVVSSQNLSPISNATVTLADASRLNFTHATRTSSEGVFRFAVSPVPKYLIGASAEGFRDYTSGTLITGANRALVNLRIMLEPSLRLTGRVLDHRSQGLPRVNVSLSLLREDMTRRVSNALTDEVGKFSFEGSIPAAGLYVIDASRLGFILKAPLQVKLPDEDAVTLYMRPVIEKQISTVWGVITDHNHSPIKGAEVQIDENESGMQLDVVKTDQKGFYRIDIPKEGSYRLIAQAKDSARASRDQTREIRTEAAQVYRIDFVLESATELQGIVLNEDNLPVGRATVQLRFEKGTGLGAFTTSEGSFRFDRVPPGQHTIKVIHSDYVPYEALSLSPQRENLTITLDKGLSLLGNFSTSTGEPIQAFTLAFVSSQTSQVLKKVRLTAIDGRFQVGGLAPGGYQIQASLSDGKTYPLYLDLQRSMEIMMILDPTKTESPIQVAAIRYLSP